MMTDQVPAAPANPPGIAMQPLPMLTEKQANCLRFLYTYFMEHRYYPTQREVMDALGVKGTNAAGYLDPLEKKGYLVRDILAGTRRNIRLTKQAIEKLELMGEVIETAIRDQLSLF